MSSGNLARCVEEQWIAALVRVMAAADGTFSFAAKVPAPARFPEAPVDARRVLMEALRRVDEVGALRRILPPPHAPLAAVGALDVTVAARTDQEARILVALKIGAGSVAESVDLLPVDEVRLLRTLVGPRERKLIGDGQGAAGARLGVPAPTAPDEADVADLPEVPS